jgi:hypothetical protein
MTYHAPNLGGIHTFFLILYFVIEIGGYIKVEKNPMIHGKEF